MREKEEGVPGAEEKMWDRGTKGKHLSLLMVSVPKVKPFGKGSVGGTMTHPEDSSYKQHKGWDWGTAGTSHPGCPAAFFQPHRTTSMAHVP